jgi:L-aspartate oxidase
MSRATEASKFDVIIIGSGAAGLTAALQLHAAGQGFNNIAVLSKGDLTAANTYYAQGGVAAVIDRTDSMASHIQDTLVAGAGLCDPRAVQMVVEQGPAAIQWLIDQGVNFTLADQQADPQTPLAQYHLTQEGGHSHRRVIHVGDSTGLAISEVLIKRVQATPAITLLENAFAIDLITTAKWGEYPARCVGVYVWDARLAKVQTLQAPYVILATGGASKAYLYTSNPDVATGDGIAMAWRASCRVANLEFNQFHPTCLYHPKAPCLLITEAMRGEGARLLLPNGEAFMSQYDARAELAPRDIVARAIDDVMKRRGLDHVCLDISHRPAAFVREHFPMLYEKLLTLGIDMTAEPIPVVPAAHYTCGGVVTDLQGRTDLPGLFAIGETACTGLHGANRMASNSLLECLVFAFSAAQAIRAAVPAPALTRAIPPWDDSQVTNSNEDVVISHNWAELRRFMWDYVGIVRTNKRLARAQHRIALLQAEIAEYYGNYKISSDLIELRNLVLVAELIVRCAQARQESRGLHYTLDYPQTDAVAKDTVLQPISALPLVS